MSGKKFVTLLTLVSFLWLLHWLSAPLAASPLASGNEKTVSHTDAPEFYEAASKPAPVAKKKSILPLVLIGVGVAAAAAVLVLVVLKTKYDIMGNWQLNFQWSGEAQRVDHLVFTGTRESGTFTTITPVYHGTYKVDGKDVEWVYIQAGAGDTYTGKFTDKNTMSGTMRTGSGAITGTWSATRE